MEMEWSWNKHGMNMEQTGMIWIDMSRHEIDKFAVTFIYILNLISRYLRL